MVCERYSRAYLYHLTKTQETLGWQLLGIHNIHFYHQLMRDIRASILNGTFMDLYRKRGEYLQVEDYLDNPVLKQRSREEGASYHTWGLRSSHGARGLRGDSPRVVR